MQRSKSTLYLAAGVLFAVLALATLTVIWLGSTAPAAVAPTLIAFAALLGAVTPIIMALRGR